MLAQKEYTMRKVLAVFAIGTAAIAAGLTIENPQQARADQTRPHAPEGREPELPIDEAVALELEGVDPGGSARRRDALKFFASLVKGEAARAASFSSTPFVLANEQLTNAKDLANALDVLAKSPPFVKLRDLHQKKQLKITKVKILEEPQLSRVVGKSFKPLARHDPILMLVRPIDDSDPFPSRQFALDDHVLVQVRAEGVVGGEKGVFDFVVAMKPGGEWAIVGFGED
jgi:hypothetical protein